MQKYRLTPKQGIYTRSRPSGTVCQTKCLGQKETKSLILKVEKRELHSLTPPDVKQSTPVLVTERMSSFFPSNVETKELLQQELFHDDGLQLSEDPSMQDYAATLLSFWRKEKKVQNGNKSPFSTNCTSIIIIYPVFKIREIPASSATSESAPETRRGTSGRPEGASAQRSPSASTGPHEASATETSSSSIVPQRDAECLRIHSSLFCPGRPSIPETNKERSGSVPQQ